MDLKLTRAIQAYGNAARPENGSPEAQPAQTTAGKAAESFGETLAKAETTATEAMVGGADPHALVEALADSQIAVETAVTVRDRVVEAYQEILRMPV